jgi:hypothetical protein
MGLHLMSMRLIGMHLVGVDLMSVDLMDVYLIGVGLIGMLCSLYLQFLTSLCTQFTTSAMRERSRKITAALSIVRRGESCGIGKVDRLVMESLPLTFPPQSPLRRR